jgi:hypothetical protein
MTEVIVKWMREFSDKNRTGAGLKKTLAPSD